jgi:hypothetical protein
MTRAPGKLSRRLLLAAAPATVVAWPGDPEPVLDAGAVPFVDGRGRAAYRTFLMMDLPRAFAVSRNGRFGLAGGALSREQARSRAVEMCNLAGGQASRLYAEDLSVVWNGAELRAPFAPPPLMQNWNYSFAPDARFLWRGARRARGAYVWAHGTSTDPAGLQPPPHVRLFNNTGYDIVRFDREPNADDVDRAAQWLRAGIRTLRAAGWHRVLIGGHSRGAWNCLQMLRTADLADAAIADSPAAHGTASGFFLSAQTDDLRQIVEDVPKTNTRLAFLQFDNDPFLGDPDARIRLITRLRPRLGGLLMIDRPPGLSGHLAARDLSFAMRFGQALLDFAA